jgi:hypothetical protein
MSGLTAQRAPLTRAAVAPSAASLSSGVFYFMTAVVAIQGGHVVEHIVQLLRATVFGVPDDRALGLLGW